MAFIEIDYQDTLRKADRLETLARELNRVSTQDLRDINSSMGRVWRGSVSELFEKRTRTFSQQIEAQARELKNLAGNLRAAAERYRRLEQMTDAIFGGRR